MKSTRILLLLFPVFLLGAGAAQAQQPLPGIQQTEQWKSMQNYVSYLQSQQNTPASAQQKQVFTNTLASRQASANNRVKSLYSQAIQRIVNRDKRSERKQINKVRRAERSRLRQLQGQRSSSIAKENASYSAQVASIRARFGSQIASTQNTISRLRRNLARTNNPFERQVILARIDAAQSAVVRLRGQQNSNLRSASQSHREQITSIRQSFTARLASARAYYDSLVQEVQTAWKKIYDSDVRAAQSNRQRQFQLVTNLRQRGNGYIAAMPNS